MSIIRKKVDNEGMVGYCHNRNCELFPHSFQGACGLEGRYFKCICCNKLLYTDKPKLTEVEQESEDERARKEIEECEKEDEKNRKIRQEKEQ